MSNTKISALTSATTPLAGTEVLPINQSGSTVQVAVSDLTAGRAVSALSYSSTTGATFATSSGNVGIGTASPQAKLQVLTTLKVSDATQAQGNVILGDGGSTSFNVGIARWNGSTNAAGAGGLGYFSQGTGNSGGHYFYTGDASAGSTTLRATIDPVAGDFRLATGNLIPVTAGKGINFTANTPASGMTSQNLTWYEEGTWTPTLNVESGTSPTYTVTRATYTRIGRYVYAYAEFNITAAGTGLLRCTFPYPPSVNRNNYGTAYTQLNDANYYILICSGYNTTYFRFSNKDGNSSYYLNSSSLYASNNNLAISIEYEV